MQVSVQLFGAFRVLGSQMDIALPDPASIADLRVGLARKLPADSELDGLLAQSRFADEQKILPEVAPLYDGVRLAILPPVSGG